MLDQARDGDVLVVWHLDRLARSLRHLIDLSEGLTRQGVARRSLVESIHTKTLSGCFMLNVIGALGSMEREIIFERTRVGIQAAAARGRVGERPPARDEGKVRAAKAMLASGTMTASEIFRYLFGTGQVADPRLHFHDQLQRRVQTRRQRQDQRVLFSVRQFAEVTGEAPSCFSINPTVTVSEKFWRHRALAKLSSCVL